MAQSKLRTLRNFDPELVDQDYRERKVIKGGLDTQYWKTFRKSPAEKRALKLAKWNSKLLIRR